MQFGWEWNPGFLSRQTLSFYTTTLAQQGLDRKLDTSKSLVARPTQKLLLFTSKLQTSFELENCPMEDLCFWRPPKTIIRSPWTVAECPAIGGGFGAPGGMVICDQRFSSMSNLCKGRKKVGNRRFVNIMAVRHSTMFRTDHT